MKIEFTPTPADQLGVSSNTPASTTASTVTPTSVQRARYQYLLIYGGIGLMLSMELVEIGVAHQTLSLFFANASGYVGACSWLRV